MLTQTSTIEPAASCAAPPPSTGTDTGLRLMSALVPSADLGSSSPGRTSRNAKVPGAMSWSAATYLPRSAPSWTSTRLTSLWVTGWPGTRLAAAAYIGTVSSAAAMTLAPMAIDSRTSTTPTTSRVSRQDGWRRRAAVGLGSSAMSVPSKFGCECSGARARVRVRGVRVRVPCRLRSQPRAHEHTRSATPAGNHHRPSPPLTPHPVHSRGKLIHVKASDLSMNQGGSAA